MATHSKPNPKRQDLPSDDRRISEELRDRILAARGDQVRKLILYGSRARGAATPDSDFDLLVVEADPVVPREESRQLRRLLEDLPVPMDVWVMGEQEFEETKDVGGDSGRGRATRSGPMVGSRSRCPGTARSSSPWPRKSCARRANSPAKGDKTMRFEVVLKKEDSFWRIEAPALDVMTQGQTRKEAYEMLKDAVELLVDKKGFAVTLQRAGRGTEVYLSANDRDQLIALMLRRQRQKHGLTLQELARRLGSKSVNAFARYEQGKARPTVSKLLELMEAIDPHLVPILKLAA